MTLQKISGKRIPRCNICGEKDIRLLVINHIGGTKEIDMVNGKRLTGRRMYDKILNDQRPLSDLEVRCHNCNVLHEYVDRQSFIFDGKILEKFLKKKGYIKSGDRIFQHFRRKLKEKPIEKPIVEQVKEYLKDYDKNKRLDKFFKK
jgi:hypothetical protein